MFSTGVGGVREECTSPERRTPLHEEVQTLIDASER
jgi:hypothetical protein